jgi:hypothetical protein
MDQAKCLNNPKFQYNNPKLQGRCIAFSYSGSVLFKKLFKENKMSCKVQVKRYIINTEDEDFSPYHYYIEIKTPTGKMIIDNCDSYNYWFYMDKFKPRGSIEKIKCNIIKKTLKEKVDIENEIQNTILYHFENIKTNI